MTQARRPKEGSRESFEEQFLCNFPERVVDPTMPKDREELQKLLNDAYRRGDQAAHDAQATTDTLRAGVAVAVKDSTVIIPDPTDEDMESIAVMLAEVGGPHLCAEQDDFQAIARTAWVCCQAHAVDWLRAHSVPASRVLKDGEVAVDAEEWKAMCAIGFDPEPCRLDCNGHCQEHNWFRKDPCPTATLQRVHALRAQGNADLLADLGKMIDEARR